ncbi:hypothetical protein FPOA_03546 [Fusarium poae]|uniref:Apple domain-containing protein n=1 Tax=Fusarium poae TaxID=36050 RepID=A0A1B8BA42_FUSPO|nr:hypothetical protein FPOA_03546 [Fusarium poae]
MILLKTTLALLFIGAASALPTNTERFMHDGGASDLMTNERNSLDSRAVCKASDPNNQAFKAHKADGSAFCSTYIRSTSTSTVTPTIQKTAFKTNTVTATIGSVTRVTTSTTVVTVITKTDTVLTAGTKTTTIPVTDFQTTTLITVTTTTPRDTYIKWRPSTKVSLVTETNFIKAWTTTTKTFDYTRAIVPTDFVYTGGTVTATTVVTTTKPAPPVVTVPQAEVHCAIVGNSGSTPVVTKGGSLNFGQCKEICKDWRYFGISASQCRCYVSQLVDTVEMDASSDFTFYDTSCNSESKPQKRDMLVKRAAIQVPSYLPSKSPSAVSSACLCLITKPAAAAIVKTTAKTTKTVTTTQTKQKTVLVSTKLTSFVTDKRTSTSTRSTTTTNTDFRTITKTDLRSAIVTDLKTYIVTNFDHLVYVTKYETVQSTSYSTLYLTTIVATVTMMDYNTIYTTKPPVTVTKDVYTTEKTVVATRTVLTGGSTITAGTTTIYGTI